jgi:hypothetical protein
MSKKRQPGIYGFTTTPDDPFLRRVAKEARPSDNFFVTSVRDRFAGGGKVIAMVRPDALPPAKVGLKVLGQRLSKRGWGRTVGGFRVLEVEAQNPRKLANVVKNELHRVKNWNAGLRLAVLVEAV